MHWKVCYEIKKPYLDSYKIKSNHDFFRQQQQLNGGSVDYRFDNSLYTCIRIIL